VPERVPSIAPAAAGLAAIAVLVALNLGDSEVDDVRGEVRLTEVTPGPGRTVDATVAVDPPSAVDDPRWVTAIAWQGGEELHLEHLSESAPGVYETSEPLPVDGSWKALIRVHQDDALLGLPIFLPKDPAIPAPEVPANAGFQRQFIDETEILQRELKDDVPGYLAIIAYLIVGAIVLSLIVLLGWVLRRLGGTGDEPRRPAAAGRAQRVRTREAPA
jgi:hypothetical protein